MIPQWYSSFWDPGISQKGPGVQTQWRWCVQVIQLDLLPSANELDLGLACFNACLFVRVGFAVVLQNKKEEEEAQHNKQQQFGGNLVAGVWW